MNNCVNCNKEIELYNYCDWNCQIEDALKNGGTFNQPNGLPIACIKHDNSMWEHEHGDHPDYKFPITVEFIGNITEEDIQDYQLFGGTDPDESKVRLSKKENHALIYTDGMSIALSIYECCFAMWSLKDGSLMGGNLWKKGEWRIQEHDLVKINNLNK